MSKKVDKTNVMRILEQANIDYISHYYYNTDAINGIDVANVLKQNPNQVFKTLATVGSSKNYYVFLVPVSKDLDLKKGAKSVGEKNIELVKYNDLLKITGYIHGGCSPLGMKKKFRTIIDVSAISFDTIIFSGGKIGYQVELSLNNLKQVLLFELADILK